MSHKGFNKGSSWFLSPTDITNLRHNIPEIKYMAPISTSSATASYGTRHTSTTIKGTDSDYPHVMLPIVYEGRFINESDESQMRKVCVIGKRVANELFGMDSPLGKFVKVNNIYFMVIGVAGQTSEADVGGKVDESITIPLSTFRGAFNQYDIVHFAIFVADNGFTPTDLRTRVERVLRNRHPMIHPDDHNAYMFFDISEQFAMIDNLFLGVSILAIFVGAGTLLAGIIGVGNIMWVIVKERTQEIGIRRAIGAKPRDIIVQILSEGVALTIGAGIAGITFATIALAITANMTTNEVSTPGFQLSFYTAVIIMVTFVVLGTAAGTIPAIKAMRIKPIEALNDK